ncbi:hypothetical protein PIB30_020705 [Stylosanthes scabra]|uniref:Phospholipase D n=1 Tax=Stylosanthes scabra TaxID=79078 RepID=A0ABU6X628_9FABA|nr:hypothetical protein [Stylosanthes scabra]
MEGVLLHGDMDATICEVYNLKAVIDNTSIVQRLMGKVISIGVYAAVYLDKLKIESRRVKDPSNPDIKECFYIRCAHKTSNIIFTIQCETWYSSGRIVLGQAHVPVEDVINCDLVDKRVEIVDHAKKPIPGAPMIHVKLQFFDAKRNPNWGQGIKDPNFPGVPRTFFSQQKGCKVSLYQDAHVLDSFVPEVVVNRGEKYNPQRCWEEMYDAINEAKHFIYIAGWSLCTQVSLVRDLNRTHPGRGETLGQLLKRKAEEDGVTVVLLLWNDITAVSVIGNLGKMGTHDKETQKYFKGSKVHCVLCTRDNIFHTHHQKIVVADAKLPEGENADKRRIVSFIGGIDLCCGRYDTQSHSLFSTLATYHKNDFHQPSIHGADIEKGGPREPWHDVHCKLEGPVAWDVYSTFVQRFKKQGIEGLLLSEEKIKDFIVSPSQVIDPYDGDTWNVQLFRSIDNKATIGLPESAEDAFKFGLVNEENKMIDRSIQDAYIQAIRRAKNFIYIENQYFIGSDFDWSVDEKKEHPDAVNLIPKELSLKIVSKIKAKERFVVYVVIPMWPEGVPKSGDVQRILYLQRRTIEMMYKDIAQALKEEGIDKDPQQYLALFCLGNREVKKDGEYEPEQTPSEDSDYWKSQEDRRFMIYVHSKMMIVDDEYIIIGSANINQRSMDGGRDTEIAMGAYQPYHLATNYGGARGQIHGFRMSLWYEHLGKLDKAFLHPESKECIKKVNQLSGEYFNEYACESPIEDLPGHLLHYPIKISPDGIVMNIDKLEFFSDTNAHILGNNGSDIVTRIPPDMLYDIVKPTLHVHRQVSSTEVEQVPFSAT